MVIANHINGLVQDSGVSIANTEDIAVYCSQCQACLVMMMQSNSNIFRVSSPLWYKRKKLSDKSAYIYVYIYICILPVCLPQQLDHGFSIAYTSIYTICGLSFVQGSVSELLKSSHWPCGFLTIPILYLWSWFIARVNCLCCEVFTRKVNISLHFWKHNFSNTDPVQTAEIHLIVVNYVRQ